MPEGGPERFLADDSGISDETLRGFARELRRARRAAWGGTFSAAGEGGASLLPVPARPPLWGQITAQTGGSEVYSFVEVVRDPSTGSVVTPPGGLTGSAREITSNTAVPVGSYVRLEPGLGTHGSEWDFRYGPAAGGAAALTGVRLKNTAVGNSQSITSGVATQVVFNNVDIDTSGYWSSGSPSQITVPAGKAGNYLIGGQVTWTSTGTVSNTYSAWVAHTNVSGALPAVQTLVGNGSFLYQYFSVLCNLGVGAVLTLNVSHTTGVAKNIQFYQSGVGSAGSTQIMTSLWAHKLS
jgi:hypothetical protein